MQHHLYADDTLLYVTFPPSEHTRVIERMKACVREVKIWLCDNGLVLNENKSEAIIIRSPNVRTPITMSRINICGQLVDTSAVIRDLGFVMDDHLSMASQVSNIYRSAYYHLSRNALTTSVRKSLIHGLVTSRLDYGNAMLFGIADRLLHRLEMVQRHALLCKFAWMIGSQLQQYCSAYTGCPSRNALSSRYSSSCTRQSTKGNQCTLPHC